MTGTDLVERGEQPAEGRMRDRGDTMLMTVILVTFLMIGAFALVSAGQAWGARRDAQAAAQAAARAAVQITPDEVRGGDVAINPTLAAARANQVAAASGYSASVSVSGVEAVVTVTAGVSYSFPAPGFPSTLTATATATVQRGVLVGQG